MKKVYIFCIVFLAGLTLHAQEFTKQLSEARTAYAGGKLDDSRFAMQQMLHDLDMLMGKEVIKLLPAKLQEQQANTAKDNVNGAAGFLGVVIHRDYGAQDKNINLEIISNSPLLTSINALLSLPFIGNSGDNKVVKIAGYKALLQKITGENEKPTYELQLPMNSSLLSLKAPGYTQDHIVQMANSLPIAQIAKMLQ
ncbi:MAG: hypothetical protein WKF97_09505 [Chitinophagaceae bacterium]